MRFGVYLSLSFLLIGCSARQPFKVTPDPADGVKPTLVGGPQTQTSAQSLQEFIQKVRKASAETKPPEHAPIVEPERSDPQLMAALGAAAARPSPEAYRAVAYEYRRLRVTDKAYEYLDKAAALAPRDGATHEARARIWRDGGFTARALTDAHRAVYYAPASPSAHNTLGTVFQALGQHREARQEYERAVALDPAAAYALNNLCYAWLLERQPKRAVKACRAALASEPRLRAARNNLGLAYAASGDIDAAQAAFDAAGDPAAARYNFGIVQLARRRYSEAVSAFAAAQQIRPNWRMAAVRAQQAQQLANAGAEE